MSVLCFGSVASLIKETTPFTREGVVEKLLNAVVPTAGNQIDKSDKYRLLNSRMELPQYIQDCVGTPATEKSIEEYFVKNIIPQIKTVKINELVSRLIGIISGDTSIVQADRDNLLSKATAAQLASFLPCIFHFALSRQNKHKTNPLPDPIHSSSVITIANGRIYLNGNEVILPDKLTPPDEFADKELVYINELLRAYTQAEGTPITKDNIPNKYKNNFNEQRKNFFNAEAVRRRVSEVFAGDESEFKTLKEDIHCGVSDVHAQDYANGYQRLLNVLSHAVTLPQGRSTLESQLKWIGSSERKGVCHFLVNDNLITWVVADE